MNNLFIEVVDAVVNTPLSSITKSQKMNKTQLEKIRKRKRNE